MGEAVTGAPTSVGTAGGLQSAVGRYAFTLIEILVVITIFMLLMGLVIGSVVRGPKLQRMIAAEQVISDCIRQARHTARTSGQPVVLKLKKGERSIGGLVRQVLWHGVEGPSQSQKWPDTEDKDDTGAWIRFDAPGRTGIGLQLPGAYRESDVFKPERADWLANADLTGGKLLWRGVTPAQPQDRPGLLLSVAVRPPVAGSGSPQVLPLALVSDSAKGLASYEDAAIGLALVLSTSNPTDGPHTTKSTQKVVPTWEIVGWFGAPGRLEVSSIADRPQDQKNRNLIVDEDKTIIKFVSATGGVTEQKEYSEAGALVGGRWTELGLLVEGDRLVLYRDGRRIGEKLGANGYSVLPGIAERVYVGVATLKTGDPATVADFSSIDDVRLERLGDALAGKLPAGVLADNERRIICHPDGRVEIDANSGNDNDTVIALTSESGERAELTVSTTGTVNSLTKAGP